MKKLFCLLFLSVASIAQPPAWLAPPSHNEPPAHTRTPAGAVAVVAKPKNVIQNNTKVMYNKMYNDSITMYNKLMLDSITMYNNLYNKKLLDSLEMYNKKMLYKYSISVCDISQERIIGLNLDPFNLEPRKILEKLNSEEKTRICYTATTISDTILNYVYGRQDYVSTGTIIDNLGNKYDQKTPKIFGLTVKVKGETVFIDYAETRQLETSQTFSGDLSYLMADFTKHEKNCKLFFLCDFIEKKYISLIEVRRWSLN